MKVPAGEGFPKAARILRRREFLAIGRTGERRHTPHFVLLARPRSGATRLGVTVSRKVGGAVARNRVKRRVRTAFRCDPDRLLPASDLVVIAKPGADTVAGGDVARELRAGVRAFGARRGRRRA